MKSPWTEAHGRLKRLYDQRVPQGMTQKEFGQKYAIGSQSMVAQYLAGTRPLNYEAAAKFARGLRCTIYDISPEMAESLQLEILPFLGKALRRAAMFALIALLPALTPSPADASPQLSRCVPQLCIMLNQWLAEFIRLAVRFLTWWRETRTA